MMIFKGWEKTSLIEYPGKISTILFTGSCNFGCPFCYNRDLVLNPASLPDIPEKNVIDFMRKNKRLYQAVILTGGEPTMNPQLPEFIAKIKKMRFLMGLETNGTNPGMLKKLIKKGLIDFVSMDIKAPLRFEKYKAAAGIKEERLFKNVLKSVKIIKDSDIDYEFRTTVVPDIHTQEDILEIARQLKGAKKYVMQQFIPKNTLDAEFQKKTPLSSEDLLKLKGKIENNFKECEARNI